MSAINISTNNFQKEVMNSDKTVLLDFWAPCRMVVPIIEEIAEERSDIKVGVSWVISSSLLPSMDASSNRNKATRLSRLFHMICSINHMTSEKREAINSLV